MAKSAAARRLSGATDDGPTARLTAYVDLEVDPQGDPQFKLVLPTDRAHNLSEILGERPDEYSAINWQGLRLKPLISCGQSSWMISTTRELSAISTALFDQLVGEEMAAIRLAVLQAALKQAANPRRRTNDQSGDFIQVLRLPTTYFSELVARLKAHPESAAQLISAAPVAGEEG